MSADTGRPTGGVKGRSIWSYNLRILLGNSYWLIVTPVAAAQLVLFWNMAMGAETLFSPVRAAQTIEILAPILGAFLCAHTLAPEQAGVRELVVARPVSLEKILLVRLSAMFAFVLALMTPAILVYYFGIKTFPLGLTMLAGLPSLLFLSMLAMAVATGTRQPLLGMAVAGAYWVLDLVAGSQFNPLVTLHGFADYLAGRPMSDQWVLSKIILVVLAGLVYLWNRRMLVRPPGPKRWMTAVQVGAAVAVMLFLYVSAGAAYKIAYGLKGERQEAGRSYFWYKQQFQTYGPLPVARLFGPAFALFMQAKSGRDSSFSWTGSPTPTAEELANMRRLVERYPRSIWADNAAFEIARSFIRTPAREVWAVSVYRAGSPSQDTDMIQEDLEASKKALGEFADTYPTSPFAPPALSMRAQSALSLLDFQTAVETYELMVRRYPNSGETSDAGIALSHLYAGRGRWRDAVAAADIGAAVASWDVRGEALLVAARAAERAGDTDGARARYEKAHAAAKDARESANEHRVSPRGLSGGQIVLRSDGVMRECEEALRSGPRKVTPAAPPRGTAITGRVERDGKGVGGVRVALATATGEAGKMSPFVETPTAYGVTRPDGTFTITDALPGEYALAAYAYSQPRNSPVWQVAQPALPIRVGGAPLTLPTNTVTRQPAPRPQRAAPGNQTRGGQSRSQTRSAGGQPRSRGGGRGGGGGGGGGAGDGRRGGGGGRGGGRGGDEHAASARGGGATGTRHAGR